MSDSATDKVNSLHVFYSHSYTVDDEKDTATNSNKVALLFCRLQTPEAAATGVKAKNTAFTYTGVFHKNYV